MKAERQNENETVCPFCTEETQAPTKSKKKKISANETIYFLLDKLEKLAIFAVKMNRKRKKRAKKAKKKNKKVYAINKKTGFIVLKKVKPDKIQKPMKRYKPPKAK